MEPTEKELEYRLRELGMRLASPTSDLDELLRLLDQTEIYLSRVEQSPSPSMYDALNSAMNSLINKEFLHHPEEDVKVFVAACVNEIIRVTAPDAPYNDVSMKDIFAMIVDAFEKLDDMSGCLYSKRVSILEIMSKIRSCVVMLDLECDDLILRMFKHFFKSIRPDHPINVFSSMETIMTLMLEESEDISQELICLLSNVQKSKKDVMPVARRLAEKVINNCSIKLKPYFLVAVQSTGTSMRDYSEALASISQDSFLALEQNEANANKLSVRTVSDESPQKTEKLDNPVSCLEGAGAFADKTIKLPSNSVMPLINGNTVMTPISPEPKPENSLYIEQCINDIAPKGEDKSLESIIEKSANELNLQFIEAKSSSIKLEDVSDSSQVDDDKEASAPTSKSAAQKSQTKGLISNSVSDVAPESEVVLESEKVAELEPLDNLVGDNVCVNSAVTTCNFAGSGLPVRRHTTNSQFSGKKIRSHKPSSSPGKKKMSGIIKLAKEDSTAIVSEHEDYGLVSVSDGKLSEDSAKKSVANSATVAISIAGISDGKSLRKKQKQTASVVADANTLNKSNVNQLEAKDVTDKSVSAEPCLKEMMVSSKASREENNDQNHWVKSVREILIRKGTKASRAFDTYLEFIGREIEVWWPDDSKLYKGVVDAFDPVTEKHRVVYDDGDVEVLLLRDERWNFINSKNFEKGQENDFASPESQLLGKKARANSRKRKASRAKGKLGRKSKNIRLIQQFDGENSLQISSEIGTSSLDENLPPKSLIKGDETKAEEPSQINNSVEPPIDTSTIKDDINNITSKRLEPNNILTSGGGGGGGGGVGDGVRHKGDSFRRKSKTLLHTDKGRAEFESPHQTKKSTVSSSGSKLDEKSKHKGEKETLKISGIMNETLKSPTSKDADKRVIIKFSKPANEYDFITNAKGKLKGKDTVEMDSRVSEGTEEEFCGKKNKMKRKRILTTTAITNFSAIKNSDGSPTSKYDDKGVIIEHVLITDADENLKGKCTVKLDRVSEGIEEAGKRKKKKKRKGIVIAADTNVSAIKNTDGSPTSKDDDKVVINDFVLLADAGQNLKGKGKIWLDSRVSEGIKEEARVRKKKRTVSTTYDTNVPAIKNSDVSLTIKDDDKGAINEYVLLTDAVKNLKGKGAVTLDSMVSEGIEEARGRKKRKKRKRTLTTDTNVSAMKNSDESLTSKDDDKGVINEYVSITNADESLKGEGTVSLDIRVSEDIEEGRRKEKKRKGTVTAADTNVSVIKNLGGLSERSVKRRNRRKRN